MPDRASLIRQWASEGASTDDIKARLREMDGATAGPVRSFIRGLPGYQGARKLTGYVADTAMNLPGLWNQFATGFGNVTMAAPEGLLRMYGAGEAADKIGAERERRVAETGDPENFTEGAARFGGTLAPYVAAGVAAGPNLLRGLAVDMALDVPVAAASRDMSLAGMAADYADPESTTGRLAGYVAESPVLRGVTEGAAGLGVGLALAKGLPAGYRALREMGEEGHVLGPGGDEVVRPEVPEIDAGPVADAVEVAATSGEPDGPTRVPGEIETGMEGRWYSRLQRAIEQAPQDVATAEQWSGMIRKAKEGQAGTELEWTGIEDALRSRTGQRLTRHEVMGLARENEIRLSEKQYVWDARDLAAPGRPKFASYTQPGGENYRETLIRLDDPAASASLHARRRELEQRAFNANYDVIDQEAYREFNDIGRRMADTAEPEFRSGHWDEPNVLAHLRTTDRTVNGEKTLFIEEIQSDWHQKGRAQGYAGSDIDLGAPGWRSEEELQQGLVQAQRGGTIPDAPFKKTDEWVGLAFRRALQDAAAGGYDRVAWASGSQAAGLYDLRKQLDSVGWTPWPAAGEGKGILQGFKDGEQVIKETISESELADYIGKEPARKLLGQPRDMAGRYLLEGEGLAVGGEGMLEFYDRIVPNVVRKEAKRLGVEIEPIDVGRTVDEIDAEMDEMHRAYDEADDLDEDAWREQITKLQEERNTAPRGARGNLSVRITPAARDKILNEGQRLGVVHPALLGPLVGAGTGAAAGAASGEEEPSLARIGLGALAGASVGAGLAGWRGATGDVTITGLREATEAAPVTPTQAALRKAEEVNLPSFNLDPTGTDRLRRHIARIEQTSRPEDLRQRRVTWEETKGVALELGVSPGDIDKVAASRMTGAETLAVRDLISQNIDDLTRLEGKLRSGLTDTGLPMTAGEIEQTTRLRNALEAQNDAYLRRFLRARSEAGRNLNNLKILANRSLDPATWLAKAEKLKGSPLSDVEGRNLRRLLAAGDRTELAQYVASLYNAPMSEKVVTLWKAGLLSNPATHLGNMVGNLTMATLETAKDAPAALFDRLASSISDVRSKGDVGLDVVAAGWRGADFRGAARQVITGNVEDASVLSKYDVQRQVSFDSWPASAFLNAYAGPKSRIFASLSAGDRIFKSFALGRSLMEQATLIAKNEGLKGEDLVARIDELIDTDTALHARAIADAEVATFLNKGGHTTFRGVDLAEAGEGLRKHLGPLGHFIAPFVRTPANIMDRVLEYSPVGLLADLPKMADWLQKVRQGAKNTNGLTAQDLAEIMDLQREMVEQAGRATLGTSVILIGYVLHERGLLTGNYPSDAAERNVHELLNEQPHSIKVDGHWLSLDRVSPVGNLLTLGAEIHRMAEDKDLGIGGAAMAAPAVLGKTVVEQSFLRGVQGGLEALSDPERSMSAWVRNTVASSVPAAVYALARAADPVVRDPQTTGEAVRARLPGFSRTVAPRISAFGEDRVRDTSLAGRVGQMASPFTMREVQAGDPAKDEVARVLASIAPYRPRGVDRGTPEYTELQREYGEMTREAVEGAIASGAYGRLGRTAARLVESDPEYIGRPVEDVTAELMKEFIEGEVSRARGALTGSRR